MNQANRQSKTRLMVRRLPGTAASAGTANTRNYTLTAARILGLAVALSLLGAGAARAVETNGFAIQRYSTQSIRCLNPGESCTFKLKNGALRLLRLESVREYKDSVMGLVRRAEVRVQIDGRPLVLECGPYVMPTEIGGLRVQADTISAREALPKQVQFSLWDAADPIVDTRRFGFPLRDYELFSHGTQAYGEPVHLGERDDDPEGQRFHHDYGFDMAGYEGREQVLSSMEGRVTKFWPSRDDPCSVVVQDDQGFVWEYAHLKAIAPEVQLNSRVTLGQNLGVLGRTGPSGNFSHLHVGTYLSAQELEADHMNRRLNLYPWLIAAYQARHPHGLLAVARPHQVVLTGEKVVLDGGNCLAWGGRRIVEWRWELPDGRSIRQARAEWESARPGAYVAALWVTDDRGAQDVDFCQVKVFSRPKPEKHLPHIFMTRTPARQVPLGQPVSFRLWPQGEGLAPLQIDFDDGTQVTNYQPFAELRHSFKAPGIHIITAHSTADGRPITQKLKVVVSSNPDPTVVPSSGD